MKKARIIKNIFTGMSTIEGAGVHCTRYFGSEDVSLFDPFLLLDDFSSTKQSDYVKGFPWHPHRGIDTITYMIKGAVEHSDSLGNQGTISEGEVQWMTSGSGIIHQEMPLGNRLQQISGFQLWLNLPAAIKMTTPVYRSIHYDKAPVVRYSGKTKCRLIAGKIDNSSGPVECPVTDPVYIDVSLPASSEFIYPTPPQHTFFIYILEGYGNFGISDDSDSSTHHPKSELTETLLHMIPERTVILYTSGDFISVVSGKNPVRFLLVGGKPIHEPIAWYGPIVMNTEKELKTAYEEFQVGTFIKHGKKTFTDISVPACS
jgi:hypothetical protein